MNDIQAGDVVVCVDDSPCKSEGIEGLPWPMRSGSIWRVSRIGLTNRGQPGFRLHGEPQFYPGKRWWVISPRFRKLNDEPDNAELIERIRACKPIRIGVPA